MNREVGPVEDHNRLSIDFIPIANVPFTYVSIAFDAERKPQRHHVINKLWERAGCELTGIVSKKYLFV